MKKFMKFCGITIAIAMLLGLALVLAGSAGGGLPELFKQVAKGEFNFGPEDFGWNSKWTTYDLGNGDMFDDAYEKVENQDFYEVTFPAGEIRNLSMQLGGCEVQLTASQDEFCYIRAEKIGTLQTYVAEETLHINGIYAKSSLFQKDSHMKITIRIPADMTFEDVKLELGAGTVHMDELSAATLQTEIGAGQFIAGRIVANRFSCEVGAGQAVVEEGRFADGVALSVGAGELKLTGEIPCDMEAECGMGNVEIQVVNSKEEEHNYELECAAGSLVAGSRQIAGLAGEKSIDNGAASTYRLECAMGNMTIRFAE